MRILYCCEGRKLDNYWVITSPWLKKNIVLYCIESGRYGPKSGVSRIIRESWQPCGRRVFEFDLLTKDFEIACSATAEPQFSLSKFFLEFDFLRKHEKSVANSWEQEVGHEIVRLTTKLWDLASLEFYFSMLCCTFHGPSMPISF